MNESELRGDSFLIVGYGREGRSIHRYLLAHYPGARIGVADRGTITALEDPHTEVFCGEDYLKEADGFNTIIRSPGVNIREINSIISAKTYLTSATNIFFAACPGKIVGVTGTKGKSTTSSLTSTILARQFADVRLVGNIGKPCLDYLADATEQTIFVIELSSYQLEDLRRSPHVAILLNIVPEHLDYHGSLNAYQSAKLNIARHQRTGDILIIDQSNQIRASHRLDNTSQVTFFNVSKTPEAITFVENEQILIRNAGDEVPLIRRDQLPIIGPGNLLNALAAITCGVRMHVPIEKIRAAVLDFKPLEHRLEFVAERCGITFINDSLSTIPEALINALQALGDKVETVIAGGYDRGIDMTSLGAALAMSKVRNLILFPTTGEQIWDAVNKAGAKTEFKRVDVASMEDAVQAAYDLTTPGCTCVMSPASSSFSLFRDYRERGEKFKEAVLRLEPQRGRE